MSKFMQKRHILHLTYICIGLEDIQVFDTFKSHFLYSVCQYDIIQCSHA